jgi:hypothetical protein
VKSIIVALPSAGKGLPLYNIYAELDFMCRKKRDECAVDTTHAIHITALIIHTILKGGTGN